MLQQTHDLVKHIYIYIFVHVPGLDYDDGGKCTLQFRYFAVYVW